MTVDSRVSMTAANYVKVRGLGEQGDHALVAQIRAEFGDYTVKGFVGVVVSRNEAYETYDILLEARC